jgi:hypothetical protein
VQKELDIRSVLSSAFKDAGYEWQIKGVVDARKRLYTLSNDTKLISKVFELVAFPVIFEALAPYKVQIETEERQTVYPDLTITLGRETPNRIAIDIKSTYRKDNGTAGFTLGSYTAYMRPPFTKNIKYPYYEYVAHWVVGFIYSRVSGVSPQILTVGDIDRVIAPIKDVEIVIQEKWRIASDKPGSGNTTNMGSVRRVTELHQGTGTFGRLGPNGKMVFEDYWRNFDRTPPRKYSNLEGYLAWRRENPA